jgi:adenine phosphoribosyltransferase
LSGATRARWTWCSSSRAASSSARRWSRVGRRHCHRPQARQASRRKYSAEYALEYGTDILEIHRDAFGQNTRVLIVDDLLATGGTATAAIALAARLQGEIVECAVIIELGFLHGRERLAPRPVHSLIRYD